MVKVSFSLNLGRVWVEKNQTKVLVIVLVGSTGRHLISWPKYGFSRKYWSASDILARLGCDVGVSLLVGQKKASHNYSVKPEAIEMVYNLNLVTTVVKFIFKTAFPGLTPPIRGKSYL